MRPQGVQRNLMWGMHWVVHHIDAQMLVSAKTCLTNCKSVSGLREGERCRKERESPGETTRASHKSRKYQLGLNLLCKCGRAC